MTTRPSPSELAADAFEDRVEETLKARRTVAKITAGDARRYAELEEEDLENLDTTEPRNAPTGRYLAASVEAWRRLADELEPPPARRRRQRHRARARVFLTRVELERMLAHIDRRSRVHLEVDDALAAKLRRALDRVPDRQEDPRGDAQ